MTVCIAISCDCFNKEKTPKLILISDMMLSTWATSADTGFKIRKLADNWYAMFAAEDISGVQLVLGGASGRLEKETQPDESAVAIAMVDSYQYVSRASTEDKFLSPFNLTMKDFVQGRHKIREPQYSQLFSRIQNFDLGCEFLIGGFSAKGQDRSPSIMHIHHPGILSPNEVVGFATIGSGSTNAFAYLARQDQVLFESFEISLYNGIAAKNLAEKAMGVGPRTLVYVAQPGKPLRKITEEKVKEITGIWIAEERDIKPEKLSKRVTDIVGKLG